MLKIIGAAILLGLLSAASVILGAVIFLATEWAFTAGLLP